jgi:hypothetical protein
MKSSKVFEGRLSEVICIYIFVDIQYLNIHERIEFVYLCLHNVVWLNTKANILCCQCINKLKIIEQFRRGIQRHFNFAFVIEDAITIDVFVLTTFTRVYLSLAFLLYEFSASRSASLRHCLMDTTIRLLSDFCEICLVRRAFQSECSKSKTVLLSQPVDVQCKVKGH